MTKTDVRGIEVENEAEKRENPVPGHHLNISLDYNIQKFAAQVADKVLSRAGQRCFHYSHESSERRNLCACECTRV